MSNKVKSSHSGDPAPCEKYLTKMLRQEILMGGNKKSSAARPFQDKFSHLSKTPMPSQRPKPKINAKQQSPIQKVTANVVNNMQREHFESVSSVKEPTKTSRREPVRQSPSTTRSNSNLREAWAQLLKTNRSKEKVSNFGKFDPLRTLHFLSKELYIKLDEVIPENEEVLQMVTDIQHALKRIPPEITTLLHNPNVEYAQSDHSSYTHKATSTKICQTPPTLFQVDTDKFKQIMAENTYRLEASCKQLEEVCATLQNEKNLTEKELEIAKEDVQVLCKRVKELEDEIENMSDVKMRQLEVQKHALEEQLKKALKEIDDNPALNTLNKLVDELRKQKKTSEETCAVLQYDMAIIKMEKEKVVTMLAVRDKEIEKIQSEMAKIQDQVNQQLKKLNTDTLENAISVKTLSDQFNGMSENIFLDIGDTTVSSTVANDTEKSFNVIKESPCGDANVIPSKKESQREILKLTTENVEVDLPSTNKESNKEEDTAFENLIKGLTPSMQAFLNSQNI